MFTELFITLGVIVFILCGISTGRSLWYMFKKRCIKNVKDESNNKEPKKRRVKAIDAFRGYEYIRGDWGQLSQFPLQYFEFLTILTIVHIMQGQYSFHDFY